MAEVIRRTPETEKAQKYSVVDLIIELAKRSVEKRRALNKRVLAGKPTDEDLMELALSSVGAGTKIAKGIGKGRFPFNLKTTDLPLFDNLLKHPAYFKRNKGMTRRIEFMSPREYFRRIKQNRYERFKDWEEAGGFEEWAEAQKIEKYANAMRDNSKFPMPSLEHRGNYLSQEGRHRMLAAERLGIDRVPTLIVKNRPELK